MATDYDPDVGSNDSSNDNDEAVGTPGSYE